MNEVPAGYALLLGGFIGLLLYGPVKRWLITLRKTLRERSARSGDQPKGSGALLVIFATMHPAPWLLVIGLPYAVYRLWNDPLRLMWACLLAGAVIGPLVLVAVGAIARMRSRIPERVSEK